MKKSGFSLIELLVVIAIVGILAAITVAQYRAYSYRTKMGAVISVLDGLLSEARLQYTRNGAIPASIYNYNTNVVTPISGNRYLNYIWYGGTGGFGNNRTLIQGYITSDVGNYIPGFVASTGSFACTACKISLGFVENNGLFQFYCGTYATDSSHIPQAYLPPGCTDYNFSATW